MLKCRKTKIVALFTLTIMFCSIGFVAKALTPEMVLKNMQLITPEIQEEQRYIIPQNFSKTNNLRRKAGSPFLAKGHFLYIEGFVFDVFGVPVENAVVRIWQTNHFGYYNHLVINKEDYSKYDIDFEGTGTAITDSNGHFDFFTIMPGYYGNAAQHINFIVEHEDFNRLETMMFFPMNLRNASDNNYKNLNKRNRFLVTCKMTNYTITDFDYGKRCEFDIRLNGLHKRKRY